MPPWPLALGPAAWAAGPATADTNPACPGASSSTATSCTYASTGGEQTFTVPSGVTAVTVTTVGAPGGIGESGSLGRGGSAPADDGIGDSAGGGGGGVAVLVRCTALDLVWCR